MSLTALESHGILWEVCFWLAKLNLSALIKVALLSISITSTHENCFVSVVQSDRFSKYLTLLVIHCVEPGLFGPQIFVV